MRLITFPVPPPVYNLTFMAELMRVLEHFDSLTVKRGSDVELYPGRLILRSPGGKRFAVRVTDAGALQCEEVA